jgi:hypothetical protein
MLWVCASQQEASAAAELLRAAGVAVSVRETPARGLGPWRWPARYAVRARTTDSGQECGLRKSLRDLRPPGEG